MSAFVIGKYTFDSKTFGMTAAFSRAFVAGKNNVEPGVTLTDSDSSAISTSYVVAIDATYERSGLMTGDTWELGIDPEVDIADAGVSATAALPFKIFWGDISASGRLTLGLVPSLDLSDLSSISGSTTGYTVVPSLGVGKNIAAQHWQVSLNLKGPVSTASFSDTPTAGAKTELGLAHLSTTGHNLRFFVIGAAGDLSSFSTTASLSGKVAYAF
jgi:hypothetical protein